MADITSWLQKRERAHGKPHLFQILTAQFKLRHAFLAYGST